MLAHGDELKADTARRLGAIGADLQADQRIRFAFVSGCDASAPLAPTTGLSLAVYMDPHEDQSSVRQHAEACVARHQGVKRLTVTLLNAVELEEAGRLLAQSDVLVDRRPDQRRDFECRASLAFEDFRHFEQVCLRERSERAYGDVIERRLAQLDDYLGKLHSLSGVTPEDFNGDWMIRCAIERTLELAIDACLCLARHLVADAGLRPPATYAETFVVAGEAGLIDSALTETLVRMCGFRNRLVHEGAHLDATLVVSALRCHLDDFDRFAASVRASARRTVR